MSPFPLLAVYLGVVVFGAAWRGQPLWLPGRPFHIRASVAWWLSGLLVASGAGVGYASVGWQVGLVVAVAAVGLSGMLVTLLLALAPRAVWVPALGLGLAIVLT